MIQILAFGRSSADIARENIVAYICIAAVLITGLICFTYLVTHIGPPKIFERLWFGQEEDGGDDKNAKDAKDAKES